MPITTPLPTPPTIADPTNFATRADAFVAALPVFQTELNAYAAGLAPLGRNMLINGAFQIDQRSAGATTNTSDDVYAFDRWNILTQTASVQTSQLVDPENGYTHAMRITQNQAAAQRFGFSQIIEGLNCKHARNGSGTLTGRVRCSAATTIRYAILGWTGTENAVTSDWVLSWTSATFTAGNFFTSTSTSVLGTGSIAVSANTWTQITTLIATLGTAFNNLSVIVWTDSTQAQNVTLDCDYLQLETGAAANPLERRSYATEFVNCQRYFQNFSDAAGSFICGGGMVLNGTNTPRFYLPFKTKMRVAATVSFPDTVGNYAIYTGGGSTVITNIAIDTADTQGVWFVVTPSSAVGMAAGQSSLFFANSTGRVQAAAEL